MHACTSRLEFVILCVYNAVAKIVCQDLKCIDIATIIIVMDIIIKGLSSRRRRREGMYLTYMANTPGKIQMVGPDILFIVCCDTPEVGVYGRALYRCRAVLKAAGRLDWPRDDRRSRSRLHTVYVYVNVSWRVLCVGQPLRKASPV